MRYLVITLLGLSLAGAAETTPPAEDAARTAKAVKLVELMGLQDSMMQEARTEVLGSLKTMRAQVPDAKKSDFDTVIAQMLDHLCAKVDWKALAQDRVKAYSENFTADELDQLATFYSGTLGHKVMGTMPKMASQGQAQVNERIQAAMPSLSADLTKIRGFFKAAGGAAAAEPNEDEARAKVGIIVGKPFPAIEGTAIDGRAVSLAKLKGSLVLVDFWATWCGPCVGEMPNVKAVYERFHSKGFEIVGISLDNDKAALTKFVADKAIPWSQLSDGKGWESDLAVRFGIRSIPASFLLDRSGNLVAINARGEELGQAVEKALGAGAATGTGPAAQPAGTPP